jgi:hypothetical protein
LFSFFGFSSMKMDNYISDDEEPMEVDDPYISDDAE